MSVKSYGKLKENLKVSEKFVTIKRSENSRTKLGYKFDRNCKIIYYHIRLIIINYQVTFPLKRQLTLNKLRDKGISDVYKLKSLYRVLYQQGAHTNSVNKLHI